MTKTLQYLINDKKYLVTSNIFILDSISQSCIFVSLAAAIGAPHVAEEDVTLGGFDVPKGTIVQFIIHTIHNDPRYWETPEKFLPERWLTKDRKIIKHDAFLPFSWGRNL